MQEIIVFGTLAIALVYLIKKFVHKSTAHNCDKCGITDDINTKNL